MSNVVYIQIDSKEFDMRFDKFRTIFRKSAMKGLKLSGRLVRDRTKKFIKDPPKTGKKYPSLPNRSSKAGESPAKQFGGLSRSIKYIVPSWDEMEVGSTNAVKYGFFLEIYLNRPFISRAVSETYNTVKMILSMSLNEGLKI